MAKVVSTRTVQGREVPPAGRWTIDRSHSQIQFVARHMMIAKVRGRFREFIGTAYVAPDPAESRVEAVINAESIDTGDAERDRHLRSEDFLDVGRYPEITYTSTSVQPTPKGTWEVVGDLTIRHVTKPVTLDVEVCGVMTDPWDHVRAAFLATGDIDRNDFEITWNQMLESGGFVVGRGVRIEADIECVQQSSLLLRDGDDRLR
jgi:polyisoprenoid-binding protein YceI